MSLSPLPPLQIERRSGPAEIVLVSGELDLCTAPHLAAALHSAQQTGADVIVDLEQVTFMDCAGLRVLLAANEDSGPARFSVTPGRRQVQRLFQLTGARALLDVVPPGVPAVRIAA
jgi:anti-sigma B factor antagonist